MRLSRIFFCLAALFILYAPTQAVASLAEQAAPAQGAGFSSRQVDESWLPLLERLQKDPRVRNETLRYFHGLAPYSPDPMGTKVKELFTNAFLRKKRVDDGTPKPPPSRIYRSVVTADVMRKCNDYLVKHKDIFDAVEKKYSVPREILVALLFVETRLGTYLGKDLALWSLASMANADRPERMGGGMDDIPITDKHTEWLQARLTDKSRWAYNELRALLEYCYTHNLDPLSMPGSVYGAIGICQFMPSNIVPYGDSGGSDGVVNLFSDRDAIFSAARYLSKHGWNTNMSVDRQRAVLRRYNNLTIYANTILALGESVRTGVLLTGPPDTAAPAVAGAKKKPDASKAPASSGGASGASRIVIVQAGNTLSGIARDNGVSVRALQEANKMGSGTKLLVGQRLIIP